MTQPERSDRFLISDVETFASNHDFIELEVPYSAMMGPYREWVHFSRVRGLYWSADPTTGDQKPALFVRLEIDHLGRVSGSERHHDEWRKVKL